MIKTEAIANNFVVEFHDAQPGRVVGDDMLHGKVEGFSARLERGGKLFDQGEQGIEIKTAYLFNFPGHIISFVCAESCQYAATSGLAHHKVVRVACSVLARMAVLLYHNQDDFHDRYDPISPQEAVA